MLVMFTTLIFGTFMDCVQKILVPPKEGGAEVRDSQSMLRAPSKVSHYEQIVHPNEEKSMISVDMSRRPSYLLGMPMSNNDGWVNSAFVNWFVNFDENKLRPWLIRNYSLQMIAMQD
jgi:hypothetical protein